MHVLKHNTRRSGGGSGRRTSPHWRPSLSRRSWSWANRGRRIVVVHEIRWSILKEARRRTVVNLLLLLERIETVADRLQLLMLLISDSMQSFHCGLPDVF